MRVLLIVLTFAAAFVILPGASGQKVSNDNVATFTITVTPQAQAPREAAAPGRPRIERINDNVLITLEKQHSGQTFEVAPGNYVVLSFPPSTGAVGFEVSPPGVFKIPKGIVHLPLHTIGLLRAESSGTVTITVKGLGPLTTGALQFPANNNSWSGYVVPGGLFASAVGERTVPTVYSDAGDASGTWVGIDGNGSQSLIQLGTAQMYSHGFLGTGLGGGPSYYAWYQVLPADDSEITIPKPVSPGDRISAFVLYGGQGAPTPGTPATWYIYMNNITQNWFFTKTVTYSGPLNSAEWIEEAPTYCDWTGCSVQKLADYGFVTFDAGDYLNVASPNFNTDEQWEISQNSNIVSIPSDPDGDRDGFTLAYGSSKPGPPGPFILTTTLPEAYVNLPYRQVLNATSASSLLWLGSNLPTWLTLDPNTGVLTGTPPSPGPFGFSVEGVDPSQTTVRTQLQHLTLTVGTNPPPPDFSLAVSPSANYLTGGCTATTTVTVTPLYGFSGEVSLSIAGAAGSAFNPQVTMTTSRLTLLSAPCLLGSPPRLYTITGQSGALVHKIAVEAIPPIKLTCPEALPGPKPLPNCP